MLANKTFKLEDGPPLAHETIILEDGPPLAHETTCIILKDGPPLANETIRLEDEPPLASLSLLRREDSEDMKIESSQCEDFTIASNMEQEDPGVRGRIKPIHPARGPGFVTPPDEQGGRRRRSSSHSSVDKEKALGKQYQDRNPIYYM